MGLREGSDRSGSWITRDNRPPTVRDILGLEAMKGGEILAGSSGLDREVTGANIVEVPEVHKWLRGGEILFTAGYAWRDEPGMLIHVLQELNGVGISALGLKLGRYLKEVPEEAIAAADEMSLPLIKIPPDVAYREVIEPLYKMLTSERLWLLERSTHAHGIFASLGLDDQSIEKVTSALADEVHNPVYVVDMVDDSAVIAHPFVAPKRCQVEETEGEGGEIIRTIRELTLGRTPTRMDLVYGHALGASLVVGKKLLGRIAVLERDSSLDEFVTLAMTHGAEQISFLLMRQVAILEGRREAADLFFDSLMSDELSIEEAAERGITLGVRLTRPCVVLLVGASSEKPDSQGPLRVATERAMSVFPHVVAREADGRGLLVLLEIDSAFEDKNSPQKIAERISSVAGRDGLTNLLVSAGSPRIGLDGVRRSRSEALIAFQVASRMGKTGLVCFGDLKVERVLAQIPKSQLSDDYIEMTIGPLEDRPDLLMTLEILLEHGGNKAATAAAIPLHRSSLAYRLEKISKLLGTDLDEPEARFELWVALRLRRMDYS